MIFTVRRLKSGLLAMSDIESSFSAIATAQEAVDRCSCVFGMQGKPAWEDFYLLRSLLMNKNKSTNAKTWKDFSSVLMVQ